MIDPTFDIERVVREVLAELGLAPAAEAAPCDRAPELPRVVESAPSCSTPGTAEVAPSVPEPVCAAPAAPSPDELFLSGRVVTMGELPDRLDAVRRVVVPRGAVVTPAVRDELIRRNITLTFADMSEGRPAAPVRLVVVATGTRFDPTALAAGLTRDGLNVEHSASDCILASTDQLAAEVAKPNTLGLLLTRHTAAGLCLANRLGGVRAVAGADAPTVAAAAAAVGANLLVADPKAGTFFQLKQMITEFCRSGVRACPDVFRARLA